MSIWADRQIHALNRRVEELSVQIDELSRRLDPGGSTTAKDAIPATSLTQEPLDKRTREWREWKQMNS